MAEAESTEETLKEPTDDVIIEEEIPQEGYTTLGETFWNICNTIQGLPILIIPYTFKTGGWWTLMALIVVAATSSYTSVVLVKSMYEERNGIVVRVRKTYLDIGEAFWRGGGRRMVKVAMIIELTCISTMYPILVGNMFNKSFPDTGIPLWAWTLIGGLAFLPNALLKSLSQVAWTSVVTVGCSGFIAVSVLSFSAMQMDKWNIDNMDTYDPQQFPITVGILVACFMSQPFVPLIESSMKRPEKFSSTLNLAYLAMTSLNILIGVVTTMTYYPNIDLVVTNNLPSGIVRQTVNSIAAVLAFASYTLPIYMTFEVIENNVHRTMKKDIYSVEILSVRICLWSLTVLMAAFIPRFMYILAFTGSFSGITLEYIFPVLFHMKIYCSKLRWIEFTMDICVIFVGVLAMISSLIVTWVSLYACFVENICHA